MAGVISVVCVDAVTDAECDIEEGVEERGSVEHSGCAVTPPCIVVWDVGCGFLLIKGSLRPGGVLEGGSIKGDPAVTSSGVWCPDIEDRDSLRGSEGLVPSSLLALLEAAS